MRLLLISLLLVTRMYAQTFDYGEGESKFGWGVPVKDLKEKSDMELKLGFRLQTDMRYTNEQNDDTEKNETLADSYLRRVRFQIQGKFQKNIKFYMDIRNDKVNNEDEGDGEFTVGDAFINVKAIGGKKWLNLRAFRAKVDVSRTQTVSSSRLIHHDRPYVTDYAAEYVSAGRRATNFQLIGDFDKKIHYQVAIGDGIVGAKFKDAKGKASDEVVRQNFMVGGKIKFSPFSGWEEQKVTETYFGNGKHFTIGLGHFMTNGVEFKANGGSTIHEVDHALTNVELSAHYNSWAFQAEYFMFDDMVEDFTAGTLNVGKGSGYYAQAEYTFVNFHYIAPVIRYESWDKFEDADGYLLESKILGLSYYMKGNKMKVGIFLQQDELEGNIAKLSGSSRTDNIVKFTTQFHY